MNTPLSASRAWAGTLEALLNHGNSVSPRGKLTFELPQHTMAVDMRHPVVAQPSRKLSSKFLGGEAYWILTGDDRVETIAPYNRYITQFSDDGVRFFGAYGPKVVAQLPYVVEKLVQDPTTRQAGLTLWRESPPETKDVPCTIAMFFNLRDRRLNSHVFMRSSDVWLGVPYDVFNFSMVATLICCLLNERWRHGPHVISPGTLFLTAASRHIYQPNVEEATKVLEQDPWDPPTGELPSELWLRQDKLLLTLDAIRQGDKDARWWRQLT